MYKVTTLLLDISNSFVKNVIQQITLTRWLFTRISYKHAVRSLPLINT
jgi:hypothetical protein